MTEGINLTKSVERYIIAFLALNFLMTYLSTLLIESSETTRQMLIVAGVVTTLLLAITFSATRKRKNWARWILVVYIGQGCISALYGLLTDASMERSFMIGFVGTSFLGLMCAFLLFFGDGMKEWFGNSEKDSDQVTK